MRIERMRLSGFKRSMMWGAVAAAISTWLPLQNAHAQSVSATDAAYEFNLPAGDLAKALDVFSEQAGVQVGYTPDIVSGKQARAVRGRLGWHEALGQLLQGNGIGFRQINDSSIVIERLGTPNTPASPSSTASPPRASATSRDAPVTDIESISVTGTRIRGGSTPSPVITIGSERIQEEGFADLGEVIRSVPQNFSGGQNPGIATGASATGNNYNTTGGSGMNLRGLGPDATLTLLNGRRLSYGGYQQSVDISAIPVEAVERLEIVPDGASAIYGSDAVGGVANVILKSDFDGVTVGARYGGATEGGLITREYTATVGSTWSSGGLLATWKKSSNDPIYSDQRDFTQSMYRSSTLWQGNDLQSGLLSLYQSFGDSVEVHLDALGSERNIWMDTAYGGIYYRWMPETKTTLVAPSVDLKLPGDWTLSLSASLGKDKTSFRQEGINAGTGSISSVSTGAYSNKSVVYEVDGEGRLFALPGGDARLAIGTGYRYNDFLYLNISGNSTLADGSESSRFAYAELSLPLVGPSQDTPGIDRLVLTAAGRTEDYDTYGRVSTPKVGLIYSPSADFTFKTSWGKSFKAPTLLQRYWDQSAYLYTPATFGGSGYPADATVLYRSGGNADLQPERAETWSASLAFHPEALPGLDLELTWFDIDYTERIVQPVVASQALVDPAYADFVTDYPAEASVTEAIANSDYFYNNSGIAYDAANVVAIVDNRYVNATNQKIKGVDLSGSYRFDLGNGRLTLRGSASWLDSVRAATSTSSYSDTAGILFYPAKISGRIGAVWNEGGFSSSVFGNYKSGVRNTADGTKGASFTTFDGTLRYEVGQRESALANVVVEFSAQNIFNHAPPLYTVASLSNAPYDSTNYSVVGRFVSVSLSKHW